MEILSKRRVFGDVFTISDFSVDGSFLSNVLEDKVRIPFVKVPGQTAIHSGRYKVVLDFSNRFQRMMPHILDVPDFEGIRIHSGNKSADTEGCLILGTYTGTPDWVSDSKKAFATFMNIFTHAWERHEEIWITIE